MLFTRKKDAATRQAGKQASRQAATAVAALCLLISLGLAASVHAQSWSEPFNHNKAHPPLGNGTWTSPYSPWWSQTVTTTAPSPSSTFPPTATVPSQVTYGGNPVFFNTNGWPQALPGEERTFNAIHMAVIPKGPYRGMVLVMDDTIVNGVINPPGTPALTPGHAHAYQAYSIIDPADAPLNGIRYRNFLVPIGNSVDIATALPLVGMSLFCSGHAWSRFGDLVFAGATKFTDLGAGAGIEYAGGHFVYVWNPRLECLWPGTQTEYYPATSGGLAGSPGPGDYSGLWVRATEELLFPRWYPTVMATHRLQRPPFSNPMLPPAQRMLFLGGVETTVAPFPQDDMAERTYEAFVVDDEAAPLASNLIRDDVLTPVLTLPTSVSLPLADQRKLFDGPGIASGTPAVEWLDEYPRCHQISTGELFFSSYAPRGAWLNHDTIVPGVSGPGVWAQVDPQPGQPGVYSSNWQNQRHDGSAVLFPNLGGTLDTIVRIGGAVDFTGQVTETVESIDAGNRTSTWVAAPGIPKMPGTPGAGRVFINTVLLPTGGVLVLGGIWQNGPGTQTPVYEPTIFENGTWTKHLQPNPTPSRRGYHSTAVLLPDGRVFIGGGNDRDYDYEIFSPPYLDVPANRPTNLQWIAAPAFDLTYQAYVLEHDAEYAASFNPLPLGQEFTKVVLMAPGSMTHHSDMSQRYVEIRCTPDGNQVVFRLGAEHTEKVLIPGIYMMFFVTNTSVSHATWVMIQ